MAGQFPGAQEGYATDFAFKNGNILAWSDLGGICKFLQSLRGMGREIHTQWIGRNRVWNRWCGIGAQDDIPRFSPAVRVLETGQWRFLRQTNSCWC